MEGYLSSIDETGENASLAHGEQSKWQARKIGAGWFAFSGTENGESTFDFPIMKVD